MRRRLLALATFALLLVSSSCAGGAEEEKTEIVVMHPWGTMEADHVAMRDIYMDFERENPNVKIKLVSLPTVGEMFEKISNMMLVGEVPDVVFCANNGRESLYDFMVENDYALNLWPYLAQDDGFLSSISPNNLSYWQNGDELYTVSDALVLSGGYWYNQDIYEAAGIDGPAQTWEELEEICETIENWSADGRTKVQPIQFTYEGYIYCIDHMLACNGGESEAAIRQGEATVVEKEFVEVLNQCRRLYPYGEGEGYSYRDETDLFNEGKLAMYVNGVWGVNMIEDDINAKYALFPAGEGKSLACESAGLGFVLGNTRDARRQECSVDFLKYMLSEPVQRRILEETEQVPANPAIDLSAYQEEMPRFYQAVTKVQNAGEKIEMPSHLWNAEQTEVFSRDLFLVLRGEMTDGEFMEKIEKYPLW